MPDVRIQSYSSPSVTDASAIVLFSRATASDAARPQSAAMIVAAAHRLPNSSSQMCAAPGMVLLIGYTRASRYARKRSIVSLRRSASAARTCCRSVSFGGALIFSGATGADAERASA